MKYQLPYKRVGFNNPNGWSSNTDDNILYRLGVTDVAPDYWTGQMVNASKTRTDAQKLSGVRLLLTDQTLRELDPYSAADKTKQGLGIYDFEFDPLDELYKLRDIISDSVGYNNLIREFSFVTKVYSVLSIANPSDEDMTDIDLFINQIYNYGNLKIIGWTNLSSVTLNESDDPNIHVNIRQIEPGKSMEFVFYGMNILRAQEIKMSYSRFASINRALVINIMVIVAVIVVLLFFFFGKTDSSPKRKAKKREA